MALLAAILPASASDKPMRFTWVPCEHECSGWVQATGSISEATPKDFEAFASGRDLIGGTVVLHSSGGSVVGAITMGRRWRELGLRTTVGETVWKADGALKRASIASAAIRCESMCAFLLLAGAERFVPQDAEVRVHQIWFADAVRTPKATTYSADDMSTVQRDIGRLARYASDMGATGELFDLMLAVPPWEPLYRLSVLELQASRLTTTKQRARVLADHAWAVSSGLQVSAQSELNLQ